MTQEHHQPSEIPAGSLEHIPLEYILPSDNNPRHLFDREPLESLKESIRHKGVLVPITVHRQAGTERFRIIDGERRYRCCLLLNEEGLDQVKSIPAQVVATPTKLAALLYMFSIHNFREGWELMPTAFGLKEVMQQLGEEHADNKRLRELTGLSEPQIERCRILLEVPERFQLMSLEPNPIARIPSNFWIEAKPVLDFVVAYMPLLSANWGERDGLTDRLVEKYKAGSIRSVIHFRRVMDALDLAGHTIESSEDAASQRTHDRMEEWLRELEFETRAAFDDLIVNDRRVKKALESCNDFVKNLERLRLNFETDRVELRAALEQVQVYLSNLLEALKGEDDPEIAADLELD